MKKERLAGALKGIDILLEGTAISLENINRLANSDEHIEAKHIEACLVWARSTPGLLALKEYYENELHGIETEWPYP